MIRPKMGSEESVLLTPEFESMLAGKRGLMKAFI